MRNYFKRIQCNEDAEKNKRPRTSKCYHQQKKEFTKSRDCVRRTKQLHMAQACVFYAAMNYDY